MTYTVTVTHLDYTDVHTFEDYEKAVWFCQAMSEWNPAATYTLVTEEEEELLRSIRAYGAYGCSGRQVLIADAMRQKGWVDEFGQSGYYKIAQLGRQVLTGISG